MYSRAETAAAKHAFWTAFGQYMQPVLNAEGLRVNWINYKTGLRLVYFRMDADTKRAAISIQILHPDEAERHQIYEQFVTLKPLLHQHLGETWAFEKDVTAAQGKSISRISQTLGDVNMMQRADWPQLISFFKPRIIALDAFWNEVKWSFEGWNAL